MAAGHISPADVTALRRRWPKAVFRTMRRRAQEVERLRRVPWTYTSGVSSAVALPGRVVRGVGGLGPGLSGTSNGEAWGFDILCPEECGEVFPSVDGNPQRLADVSSSRGVGYCGGCTPLP